MKTMFLILSALIATAASAETGFEMPQLLGVACGRPVYTFTESPADTGYTGFVRESVTCALSGRGGRTKKYQACAVVTWGDDRMVTSVEPTVCL